MCSFACVIVSACLPACQKSIVYFYQKTHKQTNIFPFFFFPINFVVALSPLWPGVGYAIGCLLVWVLKELYSIIFRRKKKLWEHSGKSTAKSPPQFIVENIQRIYAWRRLRNVQLCSSFPCLFVCVFFFSNFIHLQFWSGGRENRIVYTWYRGGQPDP